MSGKRRQFTITKRDTTPEEVPKWLRLTVALFICDGPALILLAALLVVAYLFLWQSAHNMYIFLD